MNLRPSSQILVAKCLVLNNTQHLTSDIIKWHHIQSRLDFTSFLALFCLNNLSSRLKKLKTLTEKIHK